MPAPESLALRACPVHDFADVCVVPLRRGADTDPEAWLARVFDVRSAPTWVGLLFVARQALSPLVGIPKGTLAAFAPARTEGEEVLVDTPDRHLHFWLGLAVRQDPPRLVATTVVKLRGWRGRLYWLPVGFLHRPVLLAMMRRAVRRERRERRVGLVRGWTRGVRRG